MLNRIFAALLSAAVVAVPASPASAAPSGDGLDPREPGAQSVVYRSDTVISASPARVWALLADLPGYAQWNPWVVRAEGDMRRGGTVKVDVKLGALTMAAEHTVLVVDPEHRFCWRDAGWNAWFVYGQRCRTLTVQPDGTVRLSQELLLDGALSGAAAAVLGKPMSDGMAAESAALKERAES
jgi:uncharacterized protein YndB with AHSA1/START domain